MYLKGVFKITSFCLCKGFASVFFSSYQAALRVGKRLFLSGKIIASLFRLQKEGSKIDKVE